MHKRVLSGQIMQVDKNDACMPLVMDGIYWPNHN